MRKSHANPLSPSGQEAMLAERLCQALSTRQSLNDPLRVQLDEETVLDLPPLVSQLLMTILQETAAGHAMALVPVETEITTQQAADILNVSRPYLVGMIEKGVLPSRMVGNQRRLPLGDVLTYKSDNRAKRRKTLNKLMAHDQKLGLI